MGFTLLAKGSTKAVYVSADPHLQNHVFATPKRPWHKNHLKNELIQIELIRNLLTKKGLAAPFLAIDCKESKIIKPTNQYTLAFPRAKEALSTAILDNTLSLRERIQFCKQVSASIATLHKIHMVHQDLKPENFLIFKDRKKRVVKLSDFDTSLSLSSEKATVSFRGNSRFIAPEYLTSQKGEVFSLALILIRILEEAFLPSFPSTSTLIPAPQRALPLIQQQKARGVIQYLIAHPFADRSSFTFLFSLFQRAIAYGKYKLTGDNFFLLTSYDKERAIHIYIDALENKLLAEGSLSENFVKRTCSLLKKMTAASPLDRPSAKEVEKHFDSE